MSKTEWYSAAGWDFIKVHKSAAEVLGCCCCLIHAFLAKNAAADEEFFCNAAADEGFFYCLTITYLANDAAADQECCCCLTLTNWNNAAVADEGFCCWLSGAQVPVATTHHWLFQLLVLRGLLWGHLYSTVQCIRSVLTMEYSTLTLSILPLREGYISP